MSKQTICLIIALLFCPPCLAEGKGLPFIKWQCLNLSYQQDAQITELEKKWQRIYHNLKQRIYNNNQRLRFILANPCSTDQEIRDLQNQILQDKQMLRYQAMEIFLEKRAILDVQQKEKLHEMISTN